MHWMKKRYKLILSFYFSAESEEQDVTYCMSDIHGEINRFTEMLKMISFSQKDSLYILGDVIDRASGGLELLRWVMDAPNVTMLMGNHEEMCLRLLRQYPLAGSKKRQFLWENGSSTYRRIVTECTDAERRRICAFLAHLPDHLDLELSGRRLHLVHAWPGDERDERLWHRPSPSEPAPFSDRLTLIGHTPTCRFQEAEPMRIWRRNGVLDLDCGCGHDWPGRRLACLRLEDMREFYV